MAKLTYMQRSAGAKARAALRTPATLAAAKAKHIATRQVNAAAANAAANARVAHALATMPAWACGPGLALAQANGPGMVLLYCTCQAAHHALNACTIGGVAPMLNPPPSNGTVLVALRALRAKRPLPTWYAGHSFIWQ